MISLSMNDKVFLATSSSDFRLQIDGLIKLTQKVIKQNPYSGAFFVFINRKKSGIKILHYNKIGYWLHHLRLSEGHFIWPIIDSAETLELSARELQVLLMGGDPQGANFQKEWYNAA